MPCTTPTQGHDRYLDFMNAQGLCFRMQVEDDPDDVCSFTVRVTPLLKKDEVPTESPYLPSTPSLSNFTTRERDVAMLVAEGFTNEQIASNLCISLSTVKSHLQNIFSKAQVTNRTTLVALLHGYTH